MSGVPETLAFLVGEWSGQGDGTWPSSGPFSFREQMSFEDGGGGPDFAFLAFAQHAWDPESGDTFHRERGFWTAEGSSVAVTLAHPIGVTEVAEGTIEDGVLSLKATRLTRAASGLPVTAYERRYEISDDKLTYEQFLATEEGTDPILHVWAELTRS